MEALKARQHQQARADFQHALAQSAGDAGLHLLAASGALEGYNGKLAVQCAGRARQLDTKNWKVHTTLIAAYAAAGDTGRRDSERAMLRRLHSDPAAPDAQQTSGFLVEIFPVKQYRVDAVEYFTPVEKFHIYYRFVVRPAAGRRVWQIDAASNDFDQRSWAAAHAQQAAAGERQFQLTGSYGDTRTDYRMFSGSPDYDRIRAMVVQIVSSQTTPFAGER